MTEEQGRPDQDPWWYIPDYARRRWDLECVSIPNTVRQAAKRDPSGEALVAEDGRLTFADLDDAMHSAVQAVLALGIEPGDRVALWGPNSGRWILAALGIHGAGGVLVPVNTRFRGEEAAYILRRSGAKAIFLTTDFLGTDYAALLQAAAPDLEVLQPGHTIVLAGPTASGQTSWADFLAAGATVPRERADASIDTVGPDSLSDIMFTSGTTGHPKGVMLTHGQSLRGYGTYTRLLECRPGERHLIVPPFFHTFGYKAGWLGCLIHGATILPIATFDLDQVLETIQRERITMLFGPPTIFQQILDSPRRGEFDLSSIRNIMAASTLVPAELLHRIADELHPQFMWSGYGLTEATSVGTTTVPDDPLELVATTVGRPGLDVEIRIADDAGDEVPPGEPGEILIRGYNVTQGYWQEPEQTAQAIDAQGWLHTGDIGTIDEQRYVRITDRKKDMILVGGFNVYPAEVERILGVHPAIESIAVVAAADERLGEVPVAFAVLRPGQQLTEAEFVHWAAARIANFKRPRRLVVVPELPRNASMKVLKNDLRAAAADLVTR